MIPLLALALLLAACAPAPKPDAGWDAIVACQKDPACAERKQKHWDSIHAAPEEIAALKQRVAELEKRIKPSDSGTSTTTIHPTPRRQGTTVLEARMIPPSAWETTPSQFYEIGGSSFHGSKIARFYYGAGDCWCNVWADDQGLHWEACPPPAAAKHGWTDWKEPK